MSPNYLFAVNPSGGPYSALPDPLIGGEGKTPSPKPHSIPSGWDCGPVFSGFTSRYNVHTATAGSDTERFVLHRLRVQVDSYVFVEVRAWFKTANSYAHCEEAPTWQGSFKTGRRSLRGGERTAWPAAAQACWRVVVSATARYDDLLCHSPSYRVRGRLRNNTITETHCSSYFTYSFICFRGDYLMMGPHINGRVIFLQPGCVSNSLRRQQVFYRKIHPGRIFAGNVSRWGENYHENFTGETLWGLVILVYRHSYDNDGCEWLCFKYFTTKFTSFYTTQWYVCGVRT